MNRINRTNRFLFEELTERIRMQSGAAGIAVAIIDADGNTQYEHYFGYRDAERKLPIDGDTIFGLASVTKSFVALSIMQLCEKGILDLDSPVSGYLPEFTNKNQETVTLRHLLSHTAGFYPVRRIQIYEVAEKLGLTVEKDGDLILSGAIALEGTKEVAEQLDRLTKENGLIGRPGEYMSYCNDGFGLLSEIVRRYGGEDTFDGYVMKNILKPLGMDRSGCSYIRQRQDENSAVLYRREDGVMRGGWDNYGNAFVLPGAGSMKSTLADMKRYVAMYLRYGKIPGQVDGKRILSMEGVRTMTRPVIRYKPDSLYCFGLSGKMLDDIMVIEHGGSQTGVSSNMSWSYDAGASVIVLCNTSDVPVSTIADAAMRMYCGRETLEKRGIYRECEWSREKKLEACGIFCAGEGDSAELYLSGEELCARVNGHDVNFVTVQEDLGIIRNPDKDGYIRLYHDENGKIFAVGFGGRMLPRSDS